MGQKTTDQSSARGAFMSHPLLVAVVAALLGALAAHFLDKRAKMEVVEQLLSWEVVTKSVTDRDGGFDLNYEYQAREYPTVEGDQESTDGGNPVNVVTLPVYVGKSLMLFPERDGSYFKVTAAEPTSMVRTPRVRVPIADSNAGKTNSDNWSFHKPVELLRRRAVVGTVTGSAQR